MRKCNSKQLNLNTFEALWYKILPPAHKTVVNFFFVHPLVQPLGEISFVNLKYSKKTKNS